MERKVKFWKRASMEVEEAEDNPNPIQIYRSFHTGSEILSVDPSLCNNNGKMEKL